ncbi:hypothetical protein M8C21_017734, partial [Ambrosia artemisiifolia]
GQIVVCPFHGGRWIRILRILRAEVTTESVRSQLDATLDIMTYQLFEATAQSFTVFKIPYQLPSSEEVSNSTVEKTESSLVIRFGVAESPTHRGINKVSCLMVLRELDLL